MIYTGALPANLASYSMVGEKVERSLEPLLATPASDGEILWQGPRGPRPAARS